jgi:putative intracellular protease/amidase
MVVANPSTSPVTGWPVGFWWAEVTHPWWTFTEAGYEVTLASPKGGDLVADSWSDPRDPSGYSAHDILTLGFVTSAEHAKLLSGTPSLNDVDPSGYDALFVAGGQSPMVTMAHDEDLHRFIASFYEAGKVVAIVCHATCTLLRARLSDGRLLVEGKSWTGFADAEERFADAYVGRKIQPFWIEEEARKMAGTNFVVSAAFRPHAIRDGRLVTGQQQYSGAAAAELVIEALGR